MYVCMYVRTHMYMQPLHVSSVDRIMSVVRVRFIALELVRTTHHVSQSVSQSVFVCR